MPRGRSITADEAEQYELPELNREGGGSLDDHRYAAGGSGKYLAGGKQSGRESEEEDAELELDDLQKPLLATDGLEKEGDEVDGATGELVGKGSKIEQLIADVRMTSH
jgi:hypothetical protein